jgi:diguanylate cyclase (GGDEF)-like protein
MLDLDFFKKVNDTHGHGVGDQVLCSVADVLRNCMRNTDTLARMGGEEFMLLAPLTEEAGAMVQAQRLCQAVREAQLATDAGTLSVTLSLGVASVLPADATDDAVVSRADAALYKAKHGGRDRVQLAS